MPRVSAFMTMICAALEEHAKTGAPLSSQQLMLFCQILQLLGAYIREMEHRLAGVPITGSADNIVCLEDWWQKNRTRQPQDGGAA